jgi:hypothetical protein
MAETKKAVVTGVTPNGTWNSNYGTMYKFEVSFENGDAGEYSSKSQDQNKFVVGQETEYTITSREYNGNTYFTIKPAQPAGGYTGGGYKAKADPEKDKRIAKLAVLKSATELVVADKVLREDLFSMADKMMEWVYNDSKPVSTPSNTNTPPAPKQAAQPSPSDAFDKDDDLPF